MEGGVLFWVEAGVEEEEEGAEAGTEGRESGRVRPSNNVSTG